MGCFCRTGSGSHSFRKLHTLHKAGASWKAALFLPQGKSLFTPEALRTSGVTFMIYFHCLHVSMNFSFSPPSPVKFLSSETLVGPPPPSWVCSPSTLHIQIISVAFPKNPALEQYPRSDVMQLFHTAREWQLCSHRCLWSFFQLSHESNMLWSYGL